MKVALDQTLAQIYKLRRPFSTGPDGKASTFQSSLINRCEQLLETSLKNFQSGDLRVMLHQNFYPETLVPLALPQIEDEPLLCAELYPGDLLSSVLYQAPDFWISAPDLLKRAIAVSELALSDPDLPESVLQEIKMFKAKTEFADFNTFEEGPR